MIGFGFKNLNGLADILGIQINPATEDKQDDIIAKLDDILASLGGGATSIASGRKVVSVTNTAIVLGSATSKTIFINALTTNTDVVVVGDSSVVYTEATRTGKILYPGDSLTISIDDLSKIYINGVANDGVSFSYIN